MTAPPISEPLHPADTARVLGDIWDERARQDERWGEQNHNPIEWLSVLTEEVGEAAERANQLHWVTYGPGDLAAANDAYRVELLQVAAVAVAAIEALDRQGDTS